MTGPTDPREEAEKLIASVLGSASVAADGLRGFATGSAECCVCPVCRAIAAARDPNPEFAEKLASGVGDLASGLAGVLRAFSRMSDARMSRPGTDVAGADPWRTATREAAQPAAPAAPSEAAEPAAPSSAPAGVAGEPPGAPEPAAPSSAPAGVAGEPPGPPEPGAAEPAAPPATPAPKPMAKKAVRPKAAPPEESTEVREER